MAQNRIQKFSNIDDATDFLNGAVVGGQVVKTGVVTGSIDGVGTGIQGLVGQTLIFSEPAIATVTFVASNGVGGSGTAPKTNPDPSVLLLMDLKAQIQAVIPGLTVKQNSKGHLVLIETTPTNGVTVSHTGTANPLLGFDSAVDSVGKFYKPSSTTATAPIWTWMQTDNNNSVTVVTYE